MLPEFVLAFVIGRLPTLLSQGMVMDGGQKPAALFVRESDQAAFCSICAEERPLPAI
jgi:hypothetical protein